MSEKFVLCLNASLNRNAVAYRGWIRPGLERTWSPAYEESSRQSHLQSWLISLPFSSVA